MKNLNHDEMLKVTGGAITYSLINAVTKAVTFVYNLGQAVGSAIRRVSGDSYCPMS